MKKVTALNRYLEYIVLVMYVIFITEAFLRASAFDFVWSDMAHNILRAVLLVIIIVKYVSGWIEHGLKDVPKVLILGVIVLALAASRFFNDVGSFIDAGLLLLAMKDIDLKKILRVFLLTTAILLALAMIASLTWNIENYTSYHGLAERYAFGTLSAIDFAAYFFYIEMVWFALRRDRIRYFEFGLIAVIIVALIILCNARTSAAVMTAALIVAFILKLRSRSLAKRNISKPLLPVWLLFAGAALILVFAAFIILATYRYSPESGLFTLLDRVLNRRFQLGKYGMDEYGFSLFGRMVETVGVPGTADYFFIDSSFVFILLRYGIVTLAGVMAVFVISAFHAAGKRDAWMVVILAFIALQSVMEHHLMQINYDPFIFVLAAAGGALSRKQAEEGPRPRMVQDGAGKKLPVKAMVCGGVLLAVFAASTIYYLFTCGKDPEYGIYYTTVAGVIEPGYLTAEPGTAQEVLLPKDICGVEVMFDLDGDALESDYIWHIWGDYRDYEVTEVLPRESIKSGEYTWITTDSKLLQAWRKYRFIIYPESGTEEALITLSEPANDFCRPVYIEDRLVPGSVMNFNLLFKYNDWRMMVWIFELTTLATVVYLYFAAQRQLPESVDPVGEN